MTFEADHSEALKHISSLGLCGARLFGRRRRRGWRRFQRFSFWFFLLALWFVFAHPIPPFAWHIWPYRLKHFPRRNLRGDRTLGILCFSSLNWIFRPGILWRDDRRPTRKSTADRAHQVISDFTHSKSLTLSGRQFHLVVAVFLDPSASKDVGRSCGCLSIATLEGGAASPFPRHSKK